MSLCSKAIRIRFYVLLFNAFNVSINLFLVSLAVTLLYECDSSSEPISTKSTMSTSTMKNNSSSPIEFSLFSFNIWMDGYKDLSSAQETINLIKSKNADIVVLQESNSHWEKLFKNDSDIQTQYIHQTFYNPWIKFNGQEFENTYGGCVVLSKYPISNEQISETVYQYWYPAFAVDIDFLENKKVQVFCTHLRAPFPSVPWKVAKQRRNEISTHLERLYFTQDSFKTKPCIIAGDMNSASCASYGRYLNSQGFESAFNENKVTWTYNGILNRDFDHIFYTKSTLECVNSTLYKEKGGSDHYPISASFRLF